MKGTSRARILGVILSLALAVLGCQVNPAQAEGKQELFELKPSLQAGPDGLVASLKIIVAEGYKWNAEYPFKLAIKEQTKARLSKERYAAGDLSVATDQHSAEVTLGAAGPADPGALIRGAVSFSVCDKSVCKVYRNREVEWRVTAP